MLGRQTVVSFTTVLLLIQAVKPWSKEKAVIWWDAAAKSWVGNDVPDFKERFFHQVNQAVRVHS